MRFLLTSLSAAMVLGPWRLAAVETVDYGRGVKPLLKQRCYACHGALKQKGGLRLDTGEAIRRGAEDEPVIDPAAPDSSELLKRVTSADPEERMPPKGEGEALSPDEVSRLRAWIAQGADSPADEKPEPDPLEHWAFKRPVRPDVPKVEETALQIRNSIDAFVAASLSERHLVSAGEASKETLLRRVYLDLIGLPPTREELAAFLADRAPDAYEKTVESLLASPRYAERWARHWMDIWRYADWYGRRHVPDVWNSAPQVWRWRDWIVQSLHADKGYDRMLTEMLAADEVSPEDDSTRAATGYLVRNWYALNPNQWMRDTVEHTGKAFLGLTFNCAHCHDHKYDPISQRDYFRFRAFFEPIQVRQDWVEGEPDPGPFEKYQYSVNRKVATNGMVSVFDERLDAKTFIYLRGDERTLPEGKPSVEPAMPAFLKGDGLKIERLDLPLIAHSPALKPFIQAAEKSKREQALVAATAARDAAQAALATSEAAFAAVPAEDQPGREKAEAASKKAREAAAAAEKAFDAAQTALAAPAAVPPAYPTQSTGRRRALAAWLTGRENPLTARVAVNHIWGRHFHTPLVATVFDFGRNGAAPTHPDLLDWLAVELMETNWSLKHLHRLIVTSSTYRQSSTASSDVQHANRAIDPENRYLWRANDGQMEAEVVRDSILHLAGELDFTMGGRPIPNVEAEKSKRRSLYFECFPEAGGVSAFAETFDAATPLECYRRTTSIIPQQALALSNSALSAVNSRLIAERLCGRPDAAGDQDTLITALFEHLLTRQPSPSEMTACRRYLGDETGATPADARRAGLVRVLFNHHDFVTIR